MTWLIFWFGLAIGTALGATLAVAMYFVLVSPRRIRLPRAQVVQREAWERSQREWS